MPARAAVGEQRVQRCKRQAQQQLYLAVVQLDCIQVAQALLQRRRRRTGQRLVGGLAHP